MFVVSNARGFQNKWFRRIVNFSSWKILYESEEQFKRETQRALEYSGVWSVGIIDNGEDSKAGIGYAKSLKNAVGYIKLHQGDKVLIATR